MKRNKLFKVEVYDDAAQKVGVMYCKHLDAGAQYTMLFDCITKHTSPPPLVSINRDFYDCIIPEKIDHMNTIEGMITIYYKNEYFIEITRILCN